MKRKIFAILAVCLVFILAAGGTLAYFTDREQVTNEITMGHVDISLVEKTDTTGEKEYTDGITYDKIQPGDIISKKPIVKTALDSEPVYIRVKIEKTSPDSVLSGHLGELKLDSDGWIYVNGYYYYPRIVNPGSSVTVFTHVEIPTSWDENLCGKKFYIDITAEAVQAKNFTPDFTSKTDPWQGVKVEAYMFPVMT